MSRSGGSQEPLRDPDFRSFWIASTAGFLALAVTTVAVEVLVITELEASETEVGLVRAVQFLPYLLVGLLAGAYVDRWRRRATLVTTNLGRGVLLLLVPMLFVTDSLTLPTLAAVLFLAGCFGVVAAAAEQSLLPDLVPRLGLVLANARLGQSATVTQTSGPPLAGALAGGLGAPVAVLFGAAGHLASAALLLRIRLPEPHRRPHVRPRLWRDITQGVGFVYRHRTLAPLAWSTHLWFLGNSIAITVFGLFALRGLGLTPAAYGAVLALAGLGGLAGALLAPRVTRWLGEGNVVIGGRALCAAAWVLVALTPVASEGVVAIVWCGAAQLLYGFAMGIEEPGEMGYWQASTPRELLGRMSATRRSVNRTVAVVGALAGGVLAGTIGYRTTLLSAAALFAAAVAVAWLSPFRGARAP